jgi:hypothetical protein
LYLGSLTKADISLFLCVQLPVPVRAVLTSGSITSKQVNFSMKKEIVGFNEIKTHLNNLYKCHWLKNAFMHWFVSGQILTEVSGQCCQSVHLYFAQIYGKINPKSSDILIAVPLSI